jgi:hypothetical protein
VLDVSRLRPAALALAGAATGLLLAYPSPATACDPNRFPNCQTYCGWVAWRYREVRDTTNADLPPWPSTGVAGCP